MSRAMAELIPGARLERGLTFADTQFQWSPLLITPDRPEGAPISQLVAALISTIDGHRTVTQILERLTQGIEPAEGTRNRRNHHFPPHPSHGWGSGTLADS